MEARIAPYRSVSHCRCGRCPLAYPGWRTPAVACAGVLSTVTHAAPPSGVACHWFRATTGGIFGTRRTSDSLRVSLGVLAPSLSHWRQVGRREEHLARTPDTVRCADEEAWSSLIHMAIWW